MANLILNGIILPVMATWMIPKSIKTNGLFSLQLFLKLVFVFLVSTGVYFETRGGVAPLLGLFNCMLVYAGGLTFVHLSKKYNKTN